MIYLGVFELLHVLEGDVRVDPGSEIDVLHSATLKLERVDPRLW